MTRKDYVLVAKAINEAVRLHVRDWGALGGSESQLIERIVLNLGKWFADENERFQLEKFSKAVYAGVLASTPQYDYKLAGELAEEIELQIEQAREVA